MNMSDISEIAAVEKGKPVLLHQHYGVLEVGGFVEAYNRARNYVELSMVRELIKPYESTESSDTPILERAFGRLMDAIDPDLLHGPSKRYRMSDFDEFSLLEETEEARIQPNDLVVITSQGGVWKPRSQVCGYVRMVSRKEITLSMPNPRNDATAGGFGQYMRIGSGRDQDDKYAQTKTYPLNRVNLSTARLLRRV
jgi:hypothetical protein